MQTLNPVALLFLGLLLAGCSSTPKLMPTPNIYADGGGYPESSVPSGLKSNKVDLLFVTDRAPEMTVDGTLEYGTARSASAGFGSAIVEIGNDLTWQELVEMSETSSRPTSPSLRVISRNELGRFPATPHAFLVVNGEARADPEVQAEYDQVVSQFRQEINRRMSQTGSNEVHIFIHGFNNSFDWAAVSFAELTGHAYYLGNSSTSSDIIRIINNGSRPGSLGRPLTHRMLNFWEMPVNYPGLPDQGTSD
jgi:esterase/lipase superfamily enzyme